MLLKSWLANTLVLLIFLFMFGANEARALSYELSNAETGKVSLIFGSVENDAKKGKYIIAGVKFDLAGEWDTYWKNPGDAGVPLEIQIDEQKNIRSFDILWPAPKRYVESYGLEVFAYKGQVVFPVRIFIGDGAETSGKLKATFNICSEICIPYDVHADFVVSNNQDFEADDTKIIRKYIAKVPKPNTDENFQIKNISLDKKTKTLTANTFSSSGFKDPDLIVASLPGVKFPKPVIKVSESMQSATFTFNYEVSGTEDKFAVDELDLLLVDNDKAVIKENKLAAENSSAELAPQAPAKPVLDTNIITVLLIAVLGGFILNFMPCVLPVLSIKILSVLKHGGGHESEARSSFLWSAIGIISSFVVLAGITYGLAAVGQKVGWGLQFQEPNFIIFLTILVVLFACNMWGIFEIELPEFMGGALGEMLEDSKHSKLGNFISGALATILATPCTAPFVGTAVGFAIGSGGAYIFLVFIAMGFGLALPFIAFAIKPEMVKMLPKPGVWMVKLKNLLGVLLILTALWLIWVLSMQISGSGAFIILLISTVIIASLYGLRKVSPQSSNTIMIPIVVVMSVLAFVVPEKFPNKENANVTASDGWEVFSKTALDRYISQDKLVFVDVTADWCLTCKANKIFVTNSAAVKRMFKDSGIILMKADWTNRDERIGNYINSFDRYGIPFNVVYGPGAREGVPLPELLTEKSIEDAIKKASGN